VMDVMGQQRREGREENGVDQHGGTDEGQEPPRKTRLRR
jgi:hypothetical protein